MVIEYSIWIVPPSSVREKLSSLISRLSEKYSTPTFEPHITLLGNLPLPEQAMVAKASELARLLKPFHTELGSLAYSDGFFRSVFVEVTGNEYLLKAYRRASHIFNIEPEGHFMPHLSLIYGNLSVHTKEKIIQEVELDFASGFCVNSIHLALSSSRIDPKEWRVLSEFGLG